MIQCLNCVSITHFIYKMLLITIKIDGTGFYSGTGYSLGMVDYHTLGSGFRACLGLGYRIRTQERFRTSGLGFHTWGFGRTLGVAGYDRRVIEDTHRSPHNSVGEGNSLEGDKGCSRLDLRSQAFHPCCQFGVAFAGFFVTQL